MSPTPRWSTSSQSSPAPADGLSWAQLDQLRQAASAVDPDAGLEEFFMMLAETARAVIGAHLAVVSLSRSPDYAQSVQAVSLSDRYARWREFEARPDGSGLDGFVCETNEPLRLTQAELEAHPRWRGFGEHAAAHPPLMGLLAVPLIGTDGCNLGLIQLSHRYEGEFTEDDERVLVQLALIGSRAVETGALVRTIAAQRDELEHSSARLEAVLAAIPGGIVVTDARGDVVLANSAALEVDDIHRLCVQACAVAGIHLDHGPPDRSADETPPLSIIDGDLFGVPGPDGSTRWLVTRAASLDAPGETPSGAVVVFVDNTERTLARQRLGRSETHLRQSQRAGGVGSWERLHPTGELMVSEVAGQILGLEPGTTLASGAFYDLVHPEDREPLHLASRRAMDAASSFSSRFRVIRADGGVRTVACRGEVELDGDGRARLWLGTIRDVTDEEDESDLLRQTQRMETVGRLAGGLAHDLNNLLTVLSGHAELLDEVVADPTARESVDAIRLATSRAASLTRQLLEFGRREVLQPRVIDVNEVLETHRSTFRRLLPDQVRVIYDLRRDVRPVRVDPSKLDQVLLNVVLNASDALAGSGTLLIESRRVEVDAMYARQHLDVMPGWYSVVSFSDTGPGMPADVLARVFEPFFTTKPPAEGSGMGLATSHGIINQSGGHLWLSSEVGEGTVVHIYLPETLEREAAADRPLPETAEAGGATVLLAEDEPQLRQLVETMLTRGGHRVYSATGGTEALDLAAGLAEPIDLLVTDVSMPNMGGHELAEAMLDRHPQMRVLYISGYTEDSVVIRGIADEHLRFLSKPFTSSELLASVRATLDG
jgi:PAS domain S-box-containing protein